MAVTYRSTRDGAIADVGRAIAMAAGRIAVVRRRPSALAGRVAARALGPTLGIANPLGRWRAAGVALAATGAGLLGAFWFAIPESRTVIPTRLFVAALAIGLGCGAGAWW